MELEIEIFIHSDETIKAKDTGMQYSLLECDTRVRTFYSIANIAPSFDDVSGKWFCEIISGGKDYVATKSYEEIKTIIQEHKKQNL